MSLKNKIFRERDTFKKCKLFYKNNITNSQYYLITELMNDDLTYFASDSYVKLQNISNENMKNSNIKRQVIVTYDEWKKLWYDYEFWSYMITLAILPLELKYYELKQEKIKEKIFL